MLLIITGSKGVGKSTLCQNVIRDLNWKAGGFQTLPVFKDDQRIGFDLFPLENGLMMTPGFPVARESSSNGFKIYPLAFDDIGIKAIKRGLSNLSDCILMDEIGRFEKDNPFFLRKVWKAITQKEIPVLVVLKKEDLAFNRRVWDLKEGLHIDLDLINREEAYIKALSYFKNERVDL